ncbi:cysteine proteinase [Epithele typhae]|uniref:cysteine proteinase n=1 Tax=Epithele typhae TaxID=378194 RepID=UPI0020087A72|nr:cysteine proteinase [Epithele typhae]KAH9940921.1 cysteine proteinase [Epithele typhae]
MASEASTSSPKRSASQDPQAAEANDSPNPTIPTNTITMTDNDIDEYMAEQGEDHGTNLPQPTSWTTAQKLQHVEEGVKEDMVPGATWYVVSRRWYQRWRKAMTGEEDKEGVLDEQDVGPVDNSALCSASGEVITSLVEHVDCEFVPDRVWRLFEEWYGTPKFPLPRKVVQRGLAQETALELCPPSFNIHIISTSSIPGQALPPTTVTVSSADKVSNACRAFAEAMDASKAEGGQYRVWRIPSSTTLNSIFIPVDAFRKSGVMLLNGEEGVVEDEFVDSGEAFAVEFMSSGNWLVDASNFGPPPPAPVSVLPLTQTAQPAPLFKPSSDFVSKLEQRTLPTVSVTATSPFKPNAVAHKAQEPGTMGLGNMGNTCFMNSAIQCLVHTPELMDYFLAGAFGALLHRIWDTDAVSSHYTPREFKQTLQRFAPQFSEDLNRVLQKPYVEKPDWEGGGDKELVELANLSICFKASIRAPWYAPSARRCVSITFDPFMYLTLPLPVKKKWQHTVFYIPWDLSKPHMRIPVELNRDSSFKEVRQLLGRWMDTNPDHNLDDTVPCDEMSDNDIIVCFELPCHSQQGRNYSPQPDDPFIVAVFAQDSKLSTNGIGRGSTLLEQAKDPEAMYDVVAERLQRWTAHARDLSTWVQGRTDDMEPVQIPISTPIRDAVAEITENGDVVTVEPAPEEGDIVDEKAVVVQQADEDAEMCEQDNVPRKTGFKREVFRLRAKSKDGTLLLPHDVFYIEFDETIKSYYFGDERNRYSYALWDTWEEFVHPELAASRQAATTDCLDEFTREEKLGEDDLWYSFDLWKVPDVLVVHLKRFSNSRMLRDKIDAFVDFPTEGLDLTAMVGERSTGNKLKAQGADVEALGLTDLEEPLVYDLFAVDEHMGGLGGGHYRAYALNHVTGKWYHFDDSYVTPSSADKAVNANAYLLFYRRRTSRPLGGKSTRRFLRRRLYSRTHDIQLPTPPDEDSQSAGSQRHSASGKQPASWPTPNSSSRGSPPPPLETTGENVSYGFTLFDPMTRSSADYPEVSSRGSPSSVDAEPDLEDIDDDVDGPFSDEHVLRMGNGGGPVDDDEVPDVTMLTPAESEVEDNDDHIPGYSPQWRGH